VIPTVSHVKHDLRAARSHTGTTARPEFPQPASSGSQALVLERQAVIWRSHACPAIVGPGTLWVQVAALLPHRDDAHPLGCHRARIPDRVILDKLIQILVFGCGYRRIADHTCSAITLRRRRDEWITLGVAEQLRLIVLGAYDRLLGL
jgi:hypothetical protein